MLKIFVGPKQKTIENNSYFDKSITLVGNNEDGNIALNSKLPFDYWNPDNSEKEITYYEEELSKIKEPAVIMAHNPKLVSKCDIPSNLQLCCKNYEALLNLLDDKIETRKLLNGLIPMLDYKNIIGKALVSSSCIDYGKSLVVQLPYGSGGAKTYLVNNATQKHINSIINPNEIYSVSEYQEDNTPYNIHCLIGNFDILLFPPSEQDLEITDKIEYIGSFFLIKIPNQIRLKMIDYSNKICRKLQSMGYRGVLGIDWICVKNELYFIEINPRFQGSTRQVDLLLKKSNLPSIFEINEMAFNEQRLPDIKNMLFSIYEE